MHLGHVQGPANSCVHGKQTALCWPIPPQLMAFQRLTWNIHATGTWSALVSAVWPGAGFQAPTTTDNITEQQMTG